MRGFRFDWRWFWLIGFIAILANAPLLPWPITALTLAAGGSFLVSMAWRVWGLGGRWTGGDTQRVTYWRGQRIESTGPAPRYRPKTWTQLAPVVIYGIFGAALFLSALAVTLAAFGL